MELHAFSSASLAFSTHLFTESLQTISVAVQSKAWTVFARSNAEVVGWNPTRDMDVYVRLFYVHALLCVCSGLATGSSPMQGVLPTVYRIKKLKKQPRSNKGL
jgi:hypothetical protein